MRRARADECANTAGAPAASTWSRVNGSLAPSHAHASRCQVRSKGAQWPAHIIIILTLALSQLQTPLNIPAAEGHAALETPVSAIRQSLLPPSSATESLIAVALYRRNHVTSMLLTARFSSCRHPRFQSCCPLHRCLCLTLLHCMRRGKKSSVNLCLLW